jgi:hypothetical protein
LQVAWAIELDPPIEKIRTSDVLGYVLSENIARRHLTAGQKASIAEKIANLPVGGDGSNQYQNANLTPVRIASVTQEQAATQLGTTNSRNTQDLLYTFVFLSIPLKR